MSEDFDKAVEKVRALLEGQELEGSFRFEIAEEGVIMIRDGAVSTEDGEAEVTVRSDLETFRGMFGGELSATTAFMTGRVEVEGDVGVAMRLSALLE
ncbi:MAG: SCP2 sterol-binding domain-containing protein [Pikeienuella sp.]